MRSFVPTESDVVAIEGAWRLESYVRDGNSTAVTGILLLTAGHWSTLYFVPQAGGGGYRGSAEAGRYFLKEDQLTFEHELTFQGGGDTRLFIDLASTTLEKCRIVLTPATLVIHFPSGSVIHCHRHTG